MIPHFFYLVVQFFVGIAIIPDTLDDYKMVVTWGKPLKHAIPIVLDLSWDVCMQKCWNDSTCVLVHDTSPTCELYRLEMIETVQKLPPANDSRVAFRILTRSSTCSNSQLQPLLQGGKVQSDVFRDAETYVNNQYLPYNITLENDVWRFEQRNQAFSCFVPMMPIRRDNTIWCVRVRASGWCMTRTEANADSNKQFGQNIIGPANREEYEYVKSLEVSFAQKRVATSESAMNILNNPGPLDVPAGYSSLGFWMDGIRKTDFTYTQKAGVPYSGTNEFDYTDTYANPPTLEWLNGQPDGLNARDNDKCVYLLARNDNPAGTDDMPCIYNNYTALGLCMVGYYGGKPLAPDTWN